MKRSHDPTATPIASNATSHSAEAARLRLKVQAADGSVRTIVFVNTPENDAVRPAASRRLRVLAIETEALENRATPKENKIKFPLQLFSQELLALLEAGLNLAEALQTLHNKERIPGVRAVIAELLQLLREGRTFSDALSSMPHYFPDVYIATVHASERTGDLPKTLQRYIAYQAQFDVIRKKLISASIYPVMLLVVGSLVTLFLIGYVVPRFASVYESSGRDIPFLSQIMLLAGNIIYNNWQLTLLFVLSIIVGLIWLVRSPTGRAVMAGIFLQIPWIAEKTNEFRLARFYRAISLLLASGIPLSRAMVMVNGLLGSNQQQQLSQCRQFVDQGLSFSDALVGANLATAVAESLIKVGERSGQMAEMLERTARFADDEFARWVDWASRLLEPLLMALIGIVIGTVVVLMYLPIFELAGSLK